MRCLSSLLSYSARCCNTAYDGDRGSPVVLWNYLFTAVGGRLAAAAAAAA